MTRRRPESPAPTCRRRQGKHLFERTGQPGGPGTISSACRTVPDNHEADGRPRGEAFGSRHGVNQTVELQLHVEFFDTEATTVSRSSMR